MVHHGMTHLIVTAQKRHLAVLIPSSASGAVRAVPPDSQQYAGEILFCRLVLTLLILLALNYSRNIYKIQTAEEVDFN